MPIVKMRKKYVKSAGVCSTCYVNYPAVVFYYLLLKKRWKVVAAGKIRRVFVAIRRWVLMQEKRMQMGYRQNGEGTPQLAYGEVQWRWTVTVLAGVHLFGHRMTLTDSAVVNVENAASSHVERPVENVGRLVGFGIRNVGMMILEMALEVSGVADYSICLRQETSNPSSLWPKIPSQRYVGLQFR